MEKAEGNHLFESSPLPKSMHEKKIQFLLAFDFKEINNSSCAGWRRQSETYICMLDWNSQFNKHLNNCFPSNFAMSYGSYFAKILQMTLGGNIIWSAFLFSFYMYCMNSFLYVGPMLNNYSKGFTFPNLWIESSWHSDEQKLGIVNTSENCSLYRPFALSEYKLLQMAAIPHTILHKTLLSFSSLASFRIIPTLELCKYHDYHYSQLVQTKSALQFLPYLQFVSYRCM